jgi:hypothetical protein
VTHYASRQPETTVLADYDVAIHGQSFAGRRVSEDLAAGFPQGDPGRFEIGLLHTSLDGRPGHAPYAPCTVEGLRSKGYAYWALGHVHQREIVSRDPWIVFPGNLQGRHARETGGKGASLVRVEHGRVVDVVQHDLDVVRWARVEVDVSALDHPDDALSRVRDSLNAAVAEADGRLVAARLTLRGATPIHDALVRAPERWIHEYRSLAIDLGEPGVWLERVDFATRDRRDLRALLGREDALGGLLRRIDGLGTDSFDVSIAQGEFEELRRKLPPALLADASLPGLPDIGADVGAGREDRVDPIDPEWLRARLPAVRDLLWSRLIDGEGPA